MVIAFYFALAERGTWLPMANFTRDAIKTTFIKLLEEKPLSEITVKKIVEECGINRNSFYYHFQDIPTLMEEIIKEESDAVTAKYSSVNSIVDCFDAITEFCSNRRRAIMHIYRSINRETFEHYLMNTCEYFVQCYVDNVIKETDNNELVVQNRNLIIGYYKCLCFGIVIDWLDSGMKDERVLSFRHIFELKADAAQDIARILKEQI